MCNFIDKITLLTKKRIAVRYKHHRRTRPSLPICRTEGFEFAVQGKNRENCSESESSESRDLRLSKRKKGKMNNTNNNCRFCLRIFEDLEERIGITSQISDEFRNITQTEVKCKQKPSIVQFGYFGS